MRRSEGIIWGGVLALAALLGIGILDFMPPTVKLGIAFVALFFLPGYLLLRLFPNPLNRSPLTVYPCAIGLSNGLFALIGLAGFGLHLKLSLLASFVIIADAALLGILMYRENERAAAATEPAEAEDSGTPWPVWAFIAAAAILAWLLQSFRMGLEEWDHYTYISLVKRMLEGGVAANYPFAIKDSGIDPMHSFDTNALLWACTSLIARLGAVKSYLYAAPFTALAGACAVYSMAVAIFGKGKIANWAVCIALAYHIIYAGMVTLTKLAFHPADFSAMVLFPTTFYMAAIYMKKPSRPLLVFIALTIAGTFGAHFFWGGLSLIAIALMAFAGIMLKKTENKESEASKKNVKAYLFIAAIIIFIIPYVYSAGIAVGAAAGLSLEGYIRPKASELVSHELMSGLIIFVCLPIILVMISGRVKQVLSAIRDQAAINALKLLGLGLAVSIPLIAIRLYTLSFTERGMMGINPYKFYLGKSLYILNPFAVSYFSPELGFHPVFFLGFMAIPFLIRRSLVRGSNGFVAISAVVIMLFVLGITLSPIIAPIFTTVASQAYLRRLIRFAAPFSILAFGGGLGAILSSKHRGKGYEAVKMIIVPVVISIIFMGWDVVAFGTRALSHFAAQPAQMALLPLRSASSLTNTERGELPGYSDAFRWINESLPVGSVVLSDDCTSYILTAFSNVYVTWRPKPGMGVKDFSKRRDAQYTFFLPSSSNRKRWMIATLIGAEYVIISKRGVTTFASRSCEFPNMANELNRDPEYFKPVKEIDGHVIYKVEDAG